jgi:hypothetical protein
MKKLIVISLMLGLVSAASADVPGGDIYYHNGTKLSAFSPSDIAGTDAAIGNFGVAGSVWDIAFDTDGSLYGASSASGGSFVSINSSTGAAAVLASSIVVGGISTSISGSVYSLANHGPGDFYASDSAGNFADWHWDGSTLTGTAPIKYHDDDAEAGLGGVGSGVIFGSSGDIWATSDGSTVFSTVRRGSTGYLVSVDPATAEIDFLALLPSAGYVGLAESADSGMQLLYLLHNNGSMQTWNGSVLSPVVGTLSGTTVFGATAIAPASPGPGVIPVPGAFVLGVIGLGMVGWMKRQKGKAEA